MNNQTNTNTLSNLLIAIETENFVLPEMIKFIIRKYIILNEPQNKTFSIVLSELLNKKYSYLSKIFLNEYDYNIKTYYNQEKVSIVKQLIEDDLYNIDEISRRMNYSSSSHLSHQFKKFTRMTPSQYKKFLIRLN